MDFNGLRGNLSIDLFKDQVVVVTGAGRGIGKETCQLFSRLGAISILAELSEQGGDVEDEIRRAGGRACFISTDVASKESVQALVKRVRAEFGRVDILINNAILCPAVSVADMDVELWDNVMAVNLRGTFLTCKYFLPLLKESQGIAINMTSTEAMPLLSAYIASKQGIQAFSQSLAIEIAGSGVRVIPFTPGMVDTPGIRGVAAKLAPFMGVSADQFMKLSINPAYDGMMPLEDAALATVLLAARYANEYNGEAVDGYEILGRAGVIQPAAAQTAAPQKAGSPADGRPALAHSAQAVIEQFGQVLEDTEAEINRFPVFVRPLVKRGFKGKAGASLPEWRQRAASLQAQFKTLQAGGSGGPALNPAAGDWIEQLGRLRVYYDEAPAEAARMTRDPVFLKAAADTAALRTAVIDELVQVLSQLN